MKIWFNKLAHGLCLCASNTATLPALRCLNFESLTTRWRHIYNNRNFNLSLTVRLPAITSEEVMTLSIQTKYCSSDLNHGKSKLKEKNQ